MFQAKTYTCGNAGGVRRLDNLTGIIPPGPSNWINVSLPTNGIVGALTSNLLDISTDPNNGSKVFVVGDVPCDPTIAPTWFGIGVTSNAGSLWNVPLGNYQNIINNNCYHKWLQVWVVDSATIYVCGIVTQANNKGTLVKSTDGGLTFNTCGAFPGVVDGMDCTAVHFITPLIGVVAFNNYILKTSDGGNTWIVLNAGNPISTATPVAGTPIPIGIITGIRMASDEGYIIAVGSNYVIETVPNTPPAPLPTTGLLPDSWQINFTSGSPYPFPIGFHMTSLKAAVVVGNTFIDFFSITGAAELGVFTYDHGAGFDVTPGPGYNVTGMGFNRPAAHFYLPLNGAPFNTQAGFYSKNNQLYWNPTGFNPNIEVLSDNAPYEINSVWTWYLETPPPTCYALTECITGVGIITSTNLAALVGQVVTLSGYSGCYVVAPGTTNCTGAVAVTVITAFDTCFACAYTPPPCYQLTDCSSILPNIITSNDLSLYLGQVIKLSTTGNTCWTVTVAPNCTGSIVLSAIITPYVDCQSCLGTCYDLVDCSGQFSNIRTSTDIAQYINQVVTLSTYPGYCWQVSLAPDCVGSVPLNASILSEFANCMSCLKKCYVLVDCTGANSNIITDSDLSAFVGQIIKIASCPEVCWTVLNSSTCTGSQAVTLTTFYPDCPTCLAVIKADVVLKTRSVYPNYGNAQDGCSVDYIEKVNCNFSENVYSKMIGIRYGIKSCEENVYDKWWVKKQLLDLDLLRDPAVCNTPLCASPCALTAGITVFYPIECPELTNLTATISLVPGNIDIVPPVMAVIVFDNN